MRRIACCFLTLSVFSFFSFAQDTAQRSLHTRFRFEVLGRQHLYPAFSATVKQPDLIRQQRQFATNLPVNFDTITDNPFRHGAMYVALKTVTDFKNKLRLNADLYAEYRGFSYGFFNAKNNMVIYPVLSLEGLDSLRIGNNELVFSGKLGQFINEKLAEGLTVYNLDLQGTSLSVKYKNLKLNFSVYGDLSNGIGLNIDDLTELSLEHTWPKNNSRAGISRTTVAPTSARAKYHSYLNLYGSTVLKKNSRIYLQFGFMPVINDGLGILRGFRRQVAMVAGLEKNIIRKNLIITYKPEVRYYGHAFNLFHSDPGFRYRDSATNLYEMYANTVGKFLYPLRKFDTPFSQWAVFTEYSGYNLGAISLTGLVEYKIHPKLVFATNYDLNAIYAKLDKLFTSPMNNKRSSFFIYPFFKSGIRYLPLKECYVSFFISNKSMNLDISYPTHYLHKKAFFGAEVCW